MRERRIHYGPIEDVKRGNQTLKVRSINNYSANNLFMDERLNLSPKEVRTINSQITQAKELHGVTNACKSKFIITLDNDKLAAYNARTQRKANELPLPPRSRGGIVTQACRS